jgi:hypothetical protein
MKTLSEKIIEQLQSKHDAFLGTDGELSRQIFKDGLSWAIDTVETLTNLDNSEKEYDAEQCNIPVVVGQSEQLRFLIDKFQTPKGNYLIDLLMEHKESKEKP